MNAESVQWRGIVESRGDAAGVLRRPGDAVLVQRGRPRWLLLACPCGCGDILPLNLDERAGKAWRVHHVGAQITLYPSVWRDTGCGSHFIVWRGHILDCGRPWRPLTIPEQKLSEAASALTGAWVHFAELTERLGAEPWDVLLACRQLAALGIAEEHPWQDGYFRRRA